MVRLTQDVQAAFEVESTYGDAPDTALYHLGLLDTFDPRQVEMNITPVPSLGQSTDAFHAAGPLSVTVPLKVALQGSGWQELLGNAIGKTDVYGTVNTPHCLTTGTYSHIVLVKDTASTQHTLCNGVVVNEATLTADYSTGGFMTLECNCTAMYSEDDDDGDFTFNPGSGAMAYNSLAFPSAPTTDPLLPTDMTLSYSTATTANALVITDTAGNYVEIGERYMRFYTENDVIDAGYSASGPIVSNGIVDLDHSDYDSGNRMTTLQADLHANSGNTVAENSATTDPQNLVKGIYKMDGTAVNIPAVADTDSTLTEFSNLKTVSLKIANNNTPIPGKTDSKWLQNNAIGRGKADITLDLTMTAEDETIYDLYRAQTTLPLVRLDFGSNGSIALTNGTITSFSRPLTPGGEIVDTMSIKFRGAGDYKNFSSFAISTDFTLQAG